MEKIKKSFKKCFLAVLILCVVQMLFGLLTSWLVNLYSGLFPEVTLIETIPEFVERFFSMQNLLTYPINFALALMTCPFQIGIYKFCFDKLKERKPSIGAVFGFYRNPKSILCSVICIKLVTFIDYFTSISEKLLRLYLKNDTSDIKLTALFLLPWLVIVIMLFDIVVSWLLYFWKYAYAENPDSGLKNAYRMSAAGAIFVIPLVILDKVLFWIYERIVPEHIGKILKFIPNTIITCLAISLFFAAVNGDLKSWAKILEKIAGKINRKGVEATKTAAYNIGGSYVYNQNTSAENDDNEEETPFIEPYDFFIEADERFSDEKIIETENIRGVDILAVLDEMELADDVKIDLAIRKKLKKMFEELSFEIGEYVTYEGGREIENDFTEEIDEREFEVSVEITRNSDYEPFKLILRVNVLEEE